MVIGVNHSAHQEASMAASEGKGPKPKEQLKVTVTFPISPEGPFHAEKESDTAVGAVRGEAMTFFAIAGDGQHAYYLTHSSRRVDDGVALESVAGNAKAVKFTLVKELIQG